MDKFAKIVSNAAKHNYKDSPEYKHKVMCNSIITDIQKYQLDFINNYIII